MRMWSEPAVGKPSQAFDELNRSLPVDQRMAEQDVVASQAWAKSLLQAGVLEADEAHQIQQGLAEVLRKIQAGEFEPSSSDEDIHTLVERLLTEQIGQPARKLHTGRSRNDQVATDFRLWVIRACRQLEQDMRLYGQALIRSAERGEGIPLPGYTHLRQAQPVTWDHWILAHFWALTRDLKRFGQTREMASVLPLGSGALAGTSYAVDREALVAELGFDQVSQNSIDAVSDRDFALDFLFSSALTALHLSRLAEMLVLFSTEEFGFVQLPEAYTSGSSLMPNKRNPDALELVRAKSGGLIGKLSGLMATMKALPSAYDKDLQEDKLPVFEAFDTLRLLLTVMADLIEGLGLNPARMLNAISPDSLATDVVDYLVGKGVPFRHAHELVSRLVRQAADAGRSLDELPLSEWQAVHESFDSDISQVFDVGRALEQRAVQGGTAAAARRQQLQAARDQLAELSK